MDYRNTADEIESAGDTAILPVGSVEQHGRHLPVGTDMMLAQAFADEIGRRTGATVLPCLPYSTAFEHRGKKGSYWMRNTTFFNVITDLLVNLKDQGYRKAAVIRGHGGIFVLGPALREVNAAFAPAFRACMLDPYGTDKILEALEPGVHIHADEMETSLMLYLHPELVHMERAVDFVPDVPQNFLDYMPLFKLSPEGVWGCPTKGTAEKGKACFEICVCECLAYMEKVFSLI